MSTTPNIQTLYEARQYAAGTACPGCQKRATLSAYEVQREGPNQGRLFVKCRHCGHFSWLSAAPAPDAELEQAQAAARPCPRCGKGRQARRVQKEGPNRGRLFLVCDDPACDSFEWASPPTARQPALAVPPSAPTPPRTEEGFLADIRDNSDDDAVRLIFADWLDDHGEAARAELIRVQVELAQLDQDDPAWAELDRQARGILEQCEPTWTEAIRPLVWGWQFVRGLLDEVEVEAGRFAEYAETLLREAPTAGFRVRVGDWQDVRTLVRCRLLMQVRRLTLVGGPIGGPGARLLAESPNVAGLRSLSLAGQGFGQPGAQALAGSRYLTNLDALDLSHNNLSQSAVPLLASSPNLPRLRRLVLANNLLGDSDARALANSRNLPELRELDLSGNAITREGADALLRSPHRVKLRLKL